jgi:2-keto-4-pentenoate hydratase
MLADLQSHGALVLGVPASLPASTLDLRTVQASLDFNGTSAARTTGGNPAADIWHMLAWLATHCAQRGQPLQAGQVITTGSCTGMLFAPAGALVTAELAGLGRVAVQF